MSYTWYVVGTLPCTTLECNQYISGMYWIYIPILTLYFPSTWYELGMNLVHTRTRLLYEVISYHVLTGYFTEYLHEPYMVCTRHVHGTYEDGTVL